VTFDLPFDFTRRNSDFLLETHIGEKGLWGKSAVNFGPSGCLKWAVNKAPKLNPRSDQNFHIAHFRPTLAPF
jgi:hypothetical protein